MTVLLLAAVLLRPRRTVSPAAAARMRAAMPRVLAAWKDWEADMLLLNSLPKQV